MRLHVVALPHTQLTDEYSWCAYTQKVRRFCDMMSSFPDCKVVLYGGSASSGAEYDHVVCMWERERKELFGDSIPVFDSQHPGFQKFNDSVISLLPTYSKPGDYLCLIGGNAQRPIADAHPQLTAVEWGIGYAGTFAPFRVFESYAWMHSVYGAQQTADGANGLFFDAIIPNSYHPHEFQLGDGSGDYLLYVGRLIERKGLSIVSEIQRRTGMRLLVAGDGDRSLLDCDYEYLGVIGPEEKNRVMGNARALLCPTLYLEPFGGVAVEAQLCGTPVISTDWGAFPETVEQGLSGYRCRQLSEFLTAVNNVKHLSRAATRARATSLYLTDVVRWKYYRYFQKLETLKADGWYQL